MEKTKEHHIRLMKPSFSSGLFSSDGEVENGEWLFPDADGATGPSEEEAKVSPSFPRLCWGDTALPLPDGARVLMAHPGDEATDILMLLADGQVAAASIPDDGSEPGPPAAVAGCRMESSPHLSACAVGETVVISEGGRPSYLLRLSPGCYRFLGRLPIYYAPEAETSTEPLPGYSMATGEYPRIEVFVEVGQEYAEQARQWVAGNPVRDLPDSVRIKVRREIAVAFSAMEKRVAGTGLFFAPTWVSAALRTPDLLPLPGVRPVRVEPDAAPSAPADAIALAVAEAGVEDAVLHLTLSVSRRPLAVRPVPPAVDSAWTGILSAEAFADSPVDDILRDADGLPDIGGPVTLTSVGADGTTAAARCFRVGLRNREAVETCLEERRLSLTESPVWPIPAGRFYAVGSRLLLIPSDAPGRLVAFAPGNPFVPQAVTLQEGRGLSHIVASMKALSAGQLGDFPLYSFSADGIRALAPSADGGFFGAQLISRDVAVVPDAMAPLADSLAFVSPAGVMRLSGSRVECLSEGESWEELPKWEFSAGSRLAPFYSAGSLLLYDSSGQRARQLHLASGRWMDISDGLPADGVKDLAHRLAWPLTFMECDGALRRMRTEYVRPPMKVPAGALGSDGVRITTRPISFGDRCGFKRLLRIRLLWTCAPRPFSVSASNDLCTWRLLGRSHGSPMRLNGSPWRYFRLEVSLPAPASADAAHILAVPRPLICCRVSHIIPRS